MITQILCAIDDTESSRNATDLAIGLAGQLSAGLVFCMVNPATLTPLRGIQGYLWTDDYVRSHLDNALCRARQAGLERVTCESHRATSVAYAIVTCADLYEADLIVVGANYRHRIIDSIRRTVSRGVAETANCPVLIVKPRERWLHGDQSLQYGQAMGGDIVSTSEKRPKPSSADAAE